jgi:hypothetical protein
MDGAGSVNARPVNAVRGSYPCSQRLGHGRDAKRQRRAKNDGGSVPELASAW